MVVFGAFCANATTVGFMNSTGTVQDYLLQNDLSDKSESTVGWIFSIFVFLLMLGGIQTGPLVDAYGVRPILIPGCLLWCVSVMILSVCEDYYQFILGFSVLGGIACSLIFNPSYTIISQWFSKKKPIALSVVAVGSSATGSFLPIVLSELFTTVGYGWGVRIVGFLFIVLCIVSLVTVQSRVTYTNNITWKDVSIDFNSLRIPNFLWTVAAVCLDEWAYYVPSMYIVGYARSVLKFSAQSSNLLLVYLNISSSVGRIAGGIVARYYGSFNTNIVAALLTAASIVCLWIPFAESKPGMIAFTVVFGILSGVGMSLSPACVAAVSKPENFGKRYGTTFAFVSLAILTSLPIGGTLTGNKYLAMKIVIAAVYLSAGVLFWVARQLTPRETKYI